MELWEESLCHQRELSHMELKRQLGKPAPSKVDKRCGDEMELPRVDPRDPNYDPDRENGCEVGPGVGRNKTIKLNALLPEMSEEDVGKAVEPLVLEHFEIGDSEEVLFSLEEMLLNGSRRWMIPALAIKLSMDHKPSHREMISQLVSELYLKAISQRDIEKAFNILIRQFSDLILDTPHHHWQLHGQVYRGCLYPTQVSPLLHGSRD